MGADFYSKMFTLNTFEVLLSKTGIKDEEKTYERIKERADSGSGIAENSLYLLQHNVS